MQPQASSANTVLTASLWPSQTQYWPVDTWNGAAHNVQTAVSTASAEQSSASSCHTETAGVRAQFWDIRSVSRRLCRDASRSGSECHV